MIRTRIAFGVLIAALALTAVPSAFAANPAHKERPKAFFGEFVASRRASEGPITPSSPATVKGHGEAEFKVGPWEWECEKDASVGQMTAERSDTFNTKISFKGCTGSRDLGKIREEHLKFKMGGPIVMEFKANGSGQIGEESGELKIVQGSTIKVKAKGSVCTIEIPEQFIPSKAETKPEREFESVSYSNEIPEPQPIKKYPSGFKNRLEIEWESSKFKYLVPVNNGSGCVQEGAPENGKLELKGIFEGYQEELEIKNGEFEFSTEKPEV